MAMGGSGEKKHEMVEMNVTPLIDILLVLLIILMVINPLTPLGLDALAARGPELPNPAPERALVVSIDASRQLKINQDPADIRTLGSRLEDIFKTRNDKIMFVKGDSTLPFGDVAQVIDIAKGAGVDKIGLITQKIEEGQ